MLGLLGSGVASIGMDAWTTDTLLMATGLDSGGFSFGHGWWVFWLVYIYISGLGGGSGIVL